jgi:hypothetical protein
MASGICRINRSYEGARAGALPAIRNGGSFDGAKSLFKLAAVDYERTLVLAIEVSNKVGGRRAEPTLFHLQQRRSHGGGLCRPR